MKRERRMRNTKDMKVYDGHWVGQRAVQFLRCAGSGLTCPDSKDADGGESIGRRHKDGRSRATNIKF